ncbi:MULTISPECIES: hypothetical protein [Planktothricoides]|uniref:Uncharacterized protein n=1 Tax=Planktothricoides raciborskii FACHB-1370 TaxID=2949576 RepID=A0ABR8EDL2_9CYAN|nr:hypothetical protein [Planktothricoides sp. SR001]KOR34903.1 hypothetical protein AM228_21445 [Planktothricoides sp. SR001]MBD2544901.1 hypothetical protein [Planktothricoides raciborskii FACHB-1370]MBD2583005.1 hypothetical protein [Planktothricoides raciborskii FACHB-1261]
MVQTSIPPYILYPDSDGKPIAENTLQYRLIVRLVTNLKQLLQQQVAFFAERDKAQEERDRAFAKLRELGIDPETL